MNKYVQMFDINEDFDYDNSFFFGLFDKRFQS